MDITLSTEKNKLDKVTFIFKNCMELHSTITK